jgi:hypothetical protein
LRVAIACHWQRYVALIATENVAATQQFAVP